MTAWRNLRSMYRISGRGLFLFHNPHVSQIQIKTKEKVLFPRKTLILPLHQSRRGISLQSVVCTPIHIYPVSGQGLKGFSKEEKWTLKAMAEFLFHVSSLRLTYPLPRSPLYRCSSSALGVCLWGGSPWIKSNYTKAWIFWPESIPINLRHLIELLVLMVLSAWFLV